MKTPETHVEYAQRIGPPRVVDCEVTVSGWSGYVYVCFKHDYRFNDKPATLSFNARCPMSRLEEYRARLWEANA